MKKQISPKNQDSKKEEIIQHALKTGGFLFPTTVKEVEEYELAFGSTDIILPEDLRATDFLFSNNEEISCENKVPNDTIAMAARDGKDSVPDHIKDRMKQERENARRNENKYGK